MKFGSVTEKLAKYARGVSPPGWLGLKKVLPFSVAAFVCFFLGFCSFRLYWTCSWQTFWSFNVDGPFNFFTSKFHVLAICYVVRESFKNFRKIQFSGYPTTCEYSLHRIQEHHNESCWIFPHYAKRIITKTVKGTVNNIKYCVFDGQK